MCINEQPPPHRHLGLTPLGSLRKKVCNSLKVEHSQPRNV